MAFRTASSGTVLAGFGAVFRESGAPTADYGAAGLEEDHFLIDAAADARYEKSEVSARADAFISHAWADSPFLKYLALCYYANLRGALVWAWVAWALCIFVLVAFHGFDLTALGGTPWLNPVFTLVPSAVFFRKFFFGGLITGGRARWWVDALCIHQRRHSLRMRGIRALPYHVRRSERFVLLTSETYFDRLWCCYELAVYLAGRPENSVDVMPLWLAPWTLVAVVLDIFSSLVLNKIAIGCFQIFVERLGPALGTLVGSAFVAVVGYCPLAVPVVVAYRARAKAQRCALEQLSRFSLCKTACAVEEDRCHVEAHVREVFGGRDPIGAFEETVQTEIRRLCVERSGDDVKTPFLVAAVPFMPLMWSSAASILGCDGMECSEAAAIYGYADWRVYMLADVFSWLNICLLALGVYPLILFLLPRTERIERCWLRFIASPAVVLFAYSCWGFALGMVNSAVMVTFSTGDLRAHVAVALWLGALLAGTIRFFRYRPAGGIAQPEQPASDRAPKRWGTVDGKGLLPS